jgi:hypothetical protein
VTREQARELWDVIGVGLLDPLAGCLSRLSPLTICFELLHAAFDVSHRTPAQQKALANYASELVAKKRTA